MNERPPETYSGSSYDMVLHAFEHIEGMDFKVEEVHMTPSVRKAVGRENGIEPGRMMWGAHVFAERGADDFVKVVTYLGNSKRRPMSYSLVREADK